MIPSNIIIPIVGRGKGKIGNYNLIEYLNTLILT
jgi:hypothetical protein